MATWRSAASCGSTLGASLTRSLIGFALAVVIAIPLGLAIALVPPGRASSSTRCWRCFRNTAALALLPVFVLILGIGETSKIALVLYACSFPILLNTITGVPDGRPAAGPVGPVDGPLAGRGCSRR